MKPRSSELRWLVAGAIVSVLIGLGATGHAVFSPRILQHYSDSPDSVDITRWAEKATVANIPGWWTGSWIQESSPYYRPLSSLAFWAEYLAFGWNFQGHVIISWLLHAAICALIFALGTRLFAESRISTETWAWGAASCAAGPRAPYCCPNCAKLSTGTPGVRVAFSVVAVALFNVRLGPQGPGWLPAPIAYGVVAWWPGQTDQFSLLFALLAILALDRRLVGERPGGLSVAVVFWIVSLLFKEMSVSLPLVAGALILLRKGWPSLQMPRAVRGEDPDANSVGLVWKIVIPGLVFVAAYLALRSRIVIGAWGPEARSLDYFLQKAAWYAAERPRAIIIARGPWVVVVGLFLSACIYVYARLPKRPSAVWLALTMVMGAGALAQVLAGNFALITIPKELANIGTISLLCLGIIVLLHVRRGPTWALLAMVVAIHLPVLHVQGPHYFYWPAAFWGLFNASLLAFVQQRAADGTLQWAGRQRSVIEAERDAPPDTNDPDE